MTKRKYPVVKCPKCGSMDTVVQTADSGHGSRQHRCKSCKRYFCIRFKERKNRAKELKPRKNRLSKRPPKPKPKKREKRTYPSQKCPRCGSSDTYLRNWDTGHGSHKYTCKTCERNFNIRFRPIKKRENKVKSKSRKIKRKSRIKHNFPPEVCPRCGSEDTYGRIWDTGRGSRNYFCNSCERHFTIRFRPPKKKLSIVPKPLTKSELVLLKQKQKEAHEKFLVEETRRKKLEELLRQKKIEYEEATKLALRLDFCIDVPCFMCIIKDRHCTISCADLEKFLMEATR